MERKAYILTQKRLLDTHYLALAIQEARTVFKPPVTIQRFWKKIDDYEVTRDYLDDTRKWIKDTCAPGDFVVLEGNTNAVMEMRRFCTNNRLEAVYPEWDPVNIVPFDTPPIPMNG